ARRTTQWLWLRAGGLALVTLYACCFVNVAGVVARHNLAQAGIAQDQFYLCVLGEGAVPAIRAWEVANRRGICGVVRIAAPADWREWGYRNARLRRSLDAVYEGQGVQWRPAY
ncbi:MAG: DUF4173 domain-containing protein, partial [Rhodobacterales bacterium]|nr:DUF4173 domain-containing protein [Rhodobacterales bacterium]